MLGLVLAATIALGPEITSVPYTPTPPQADCSAAALAKTSEGIFLAWPMVNEGREGMMAVLLDATFHVIPGKSVFLPRPTTPVCPSAASDGATVMLVWAAASTSTTTAIEATRFRSSLELIDGPEVIDAHTPLSSSPGVAWSPLAGGTFLFTAGDFWFELASSSPIASRRGYGIHGWRVQESQWSYRYDAVAAGAAGFALSARASVPATTSCFLYRCGTSGPSVSVGAAYPHWLWPWEMTTRGGTVPPPTAIACIGYECLVSWADDAVQARWLNALKTQPHISLGSTQAPSSIASAADDDSIIVVWENEKNAIVGAEVALDRVRRSFMIAEGPEARTGPSIVKLGPGRFLVAYRITDGTTTRIGGRVMNLDSPPRRRIAR
jgi:hypothetical protein